MLKALVETQRVDDKETATFVIEKQYGWNPFHARIVSLFLWHSKIIAHHHKRVSPSAHLTKEQPALIVSAAPTASREGFTSTKSMAIRLPVSCTHSAM